MIPITEICNHIFENLFYDEDLGELIHEGNRIHWMEEDEYEYTRVFVNDVEGFERRIYKEDVENIIYTDEDDDDDNRILDDDDYDEIHHEDEDEDYDEDEAYYSE
jgi:hypothetical protein